MSLEIKGTLREAPIRAVIYGSDGVGKSTLAAGAPDAVFVNLEDGGLDHIDARAVGSVSDWQSIIDAVYALIQERSCKSIVIDSLDWAEQLLWTHIITTQPDEKGRKVKNIEGYGYGKGYVAAQNEWRGLLAALTQAGKAGKHVIMTAHAHRKSVKNPAGEDYEQWQIKLNDKAAGIIREWAHIVGFAELDIATVTDKDDGGRTKGVFSGRRILRTAPSAGYQGKTRLTMPAKIPLDWKSLADAVRAGRPPTTDALFATLQAKLAHLGSQEVFASCAAFLESRGKTLASLNDAISAVDIHLSKKEAISGNH